MKKVIPILILICMVTTAFAESDSTQVVKTKGRWEHFNYLSINGTFFLQQFLTFTNQTTTIAPSPYIIEYKFLPKHHGFRFGFGGNFSNKKNYQDSSQITINKTTAFNFRLGYIYQHNITKHWAFFAGLDMVSTISNTSAVTNTVLDISTTKNNSYSIGAGPSFGIQFAINKRLGLFTETAFYYQMVKGSAGTTSVNFPETNNVSHSIENNLKFIIPTSIFFYVRL